MAVNRRIESDRLRTWDPMTGFGFSGAGLLTGSVEKSLKSATAAVISVGISLSLRWIVSWGPLSVRSQAIEAKPSPSVCDDQ